MNCWEGLRQKLAHLTFASPEETYERTQDSTLNEVLAGKAFLACGVNGETLLEKHGFPLRVVVEAI